MSRTPSIYRRFGKRWLDAAAAAALLLLLAPVLLLLALVVRIRLGSPVLFRQYRPGLNGRPFLMYKFRTMTNARDSRGRLLSDGARLTPLGRLLRATSLDELPQLWNVLCGEMSLVGPRPLVMDYLDRYSPEQARRHNVKPGITGLAQVNGRNRIDWETKFAFDVWYVEHLSLRLDVEILWRTIGVVLRRDGITFGDAPTVVEFLGAGTRAAAPQLVPLENLELESAGAVAAGLRESTPAHTPAAVRPQSRPRARSAA